MLIKKWFRILFNSPEWKSVLKAMLLMKEIEEFKKERWMRGGKVKSEK